MQSKTSTRELIDDWDDVIEGLGNTEAGLKNCRNMPTIPQLCFMRTSEPTAEILR